MITDEGKRKEEKGRKFEVWSLNVKTMTGKSAEVVYNTHL